MATLTGSTIADTYEQLIKLDTETLDDDANGKWLETGKAENLPISVSTNRVGIGVRTADNILEVSHNATTAVAVAQIFDNTIQGIHIAKTGTNDGAGSMLKFSADGDTNQAAIVHIADDTSGDANLAFYTSDAVDAIIERMRITSDGYVGIGTPSPGSLLHIKKTATTGGAPLELIRLEINETSDVELARGEGPAIDFYIAETGGSQLGGRIAQVRESIIDATAHSAMTFHTAEDDESLVEAMRIDYLGRVGIGTTTPGSGVNLDIEDTGTAGTGAGGNLRLSSNDSTVMVSTDRLGVIEFAGAEDTNSTMTVGARIEAVASETWDASNNGASLDFYTTAGNDDATQRMTILAGGDVGIGTPSPDDKLHVYGASGNVSARVESLSLADTEISRWLVEGRKSGGDDNYAEVGVVYNDSPTGGTDQTAGYLRLDESDGASSYVWFSDDDVFRIGASQSLVGSTGGTTTGHDYSDERLKDISSDVFPYGLDAINNLTPIKYKWKKDPDLGDRFGFGAQTTQSIIPELVSESSFLLDNGEKKLVMEYRMMHSVLVKAIQELSAKVTALENA